MDVRIVEAVTRREMKDFFRFPMRLYAGCPYYVPPLLLDELETFNRAKNPAFDTADARLFLARRGDATVGRIAGIVSRAANEKDGVRDVRFGWFDCIDDPLAARALFDTVSEWGRTLGMESMSGPHGFSLFDREGLLVEGFDRMPTFATYYNHPYYQDLVEGYGFGKRYDFVEYRTEDFDRKVFPARVSDLVDKVMARGRFRVMKFKNRREIRAMGPQVFDLLEEAYMELDDMVPFTKKQIEYYIPKFMPFMHRELLKVVVAEDGEVAGFMIAMPSISEALQKANGRLLPFGFLHLLRALRKFDTLDFCLAGVRKKYRGKGVDLIMAREMFRSAKKLGVKHTESNPELETNTRIQSEWKHFDPILHKRRRIYEMRIAEAHIVPFRGPRPAAPASAPSREAAAAAQRAIGGDAPPPGG
jgi:hypothetical protein